MNKFYFAALLLCFTGSVFADADQDQTTNLRVLIWSDFKDACVNPQNFQAQRPPENIKIVCKDLQYSWAAIAEGQLQLVNVPRVVTSEVFSDKYHVSMSANQMSVAATIGACTKYKEVAQSFATERNVSCEEIAEFKGDLDDYCASISSDMESKDVSASEVKDTGRVIDTCAEPSDAKQDQAQQDPAQSAAKAVNPCSQPKHIIGDLYRCED